MKDSWNKLNFKPAAIKNCMEDESKYHKAKIVGFSLLMAGVATTYQSYFNGLVYRSGMYQQRALSGYEQFTYFRDFKNPGTLWQPRNELDVLEAKEFKQLKYIQTGDSVDEWPTNWWDANTATDAWTEIGMDFEEPAPVDDATETTNIGSSYTHDGTRGGYKAGGGWLDTIWKKARKAAEPDTDRENSGNLKVQLSDGYTAWVTGDAYNNANGNEYDNNKLYFTQVQRWDESYEDNILKDAAGTGWLQYRRDRYKDWEKMHKNVLWFDTAACLDYGHIGNVNKVGIYPTTTRYRKIENKYCTATELSDNEWDNCYKMESEQDGQWWKDRTTEKGTYNPAYWEKKNAGTITPEEEETIPNKIDTPQSANVPYLDKFSTTTQDTDNPDAPEDLRNDANIKRNDTPWRQSWDTSIRIDGKMNWADENLYRDLLKDYIALGEDCDVDCQANGSQLTTIAGLMGAVYGLVALNAVFMFIGTWRYKWRVCSIYMTFGVCLFQLAATIAAGALLFTKYNAICARSIRETMGDGNLWSMADDFYITFSLWITSFIAMFCFLCCGLCSACAESK